MANIVTVIFQAVTNNVTSAIKGIGNQLNTLGAKAGEVGNRFASMMEGANTSALRTHSSLLSLRSLLASIVSAYAGKKLFEFTLGNAASFEYYQMQYDILLKKENNYAVGVNKAAQTAKQRMNELMAFNLTTPFELEPIIKADKALETFGIRSKQALQLVGDAAAGTGQEIDEVAFWIGRLAARDGMAFQRLMEMSIITRDDLKKMGLEFDKNNRYVGDYNELLTKVFTYINKNYGGAMHKLSTTAIGVKSNLMDALSLFGRDIGTKALDNAKESMQKLIDKIYELRANGTLDVWAAKIGNVINFIINAAFWAVTQIGVIAPYLDGVFSFIGNNIGWLSKLIVMGIQWWISWRVAIMLTTGALAGIQIIAGIIQFLGILIPAMKTATITQWAWNAALNANPIMAIVTLIALLIMGIIQLARNWDKCKLVFQIAGQAILIAILGLVDGILWLWKKEVEFVAWMTSWIPGISNLTQWAADRFEDMSNSVNNSLDKSIIKMREYQKELGNLNKKDKSDDPTKEFKKDPTKLEAPEALKLPEKDIPKFQGLGSSANDKKSTREKDAIDIIEEQFKYKVSIVQDKAKIIENEVDKPGKNQAWKKALNDWIGVLQNEIKSVQRVIAHSTGELREKAEAKKIELLKQISEINKDIREKINHLVDEFNVPSGITPTSLLAYRMGTMKQSGGFTIAGGNFIFQVKEAPRTKEQWKQVFDISQDALSEQLDKTRKAKG